MSRLKESDLEDMQRLILQGYPDRKFARYRLFRIKYPDKVRRNLQTMLRLGWFGTADWFDRQRDKREKLTPRLGIAFTMAGLQELGMDEDTLHNLPLAFVEGMTAKYRARRLGDDPDSFLWRNDDPDLHGVLMQFTTHGQVWLDWEFLLIKWLCALEAGRFGFDIIRHLPVAEILPGLKDHFGFRDGISQPYIDGSQTSDRPQGQFAKAHMVKPGEFILGHTNESNVIIPPLWVEEPQLTIGPQDTSYYKWLDVEGIGIGRRDFGRNGTYMVFRQLQQDVNGYDDYLNSTAWYALSKDWPEKSWERLLEKFFIDPARRVDDIANFDEFLRTCGRISLRAVLADLSHQLMAAAIRPRPEDARPTLRTEAQNAIQAWIDDHRTLEIIELLKRLSDDGVPPEAPDVDLLFKGVDSETRARFLKEIRAIDIWADRSLREMNAFIAQKASELLKGDRRDFVFEFTGYSASVPVADAPTLAPDPVFVAAPMPVATLAAPAPGLAGPYGFPPPQPTPTSVVPADPPLTGTPWVPPPPPIPPLPYPFFGPPIIRLITALMLEKEPLSAKFIGRWRSGAPLVKAEERDKPWLEDENDFMFLPEDRYGFRCPIGAHIRRANPRDALVNERGGVDRDGSLARSRRARIIRRGRPYSEFGGTEVGIHFIALNASLRDQFEFIQADWINKPDFAGLRNEVDPLMGTFRDPAARREFTVQGAPLSQRIGAPPEPQLPDFVKVRGGAYFFMPGIRALKFLARLTYP